MTPVTDATALYRMTQPLSLAPIVALVTDAVTSPHTRRAYGRALTAFLVWWNTDGRNPLTKQVVARYVTHLRADGVTPSSINQRLVAIRRLAHEAADNGMISQSDAQAIARAQGVRSEGKRMGNWLTQEQAQALIDAPDVTTVKGLRDRALLALLLGTGLRREECASLTVEHLQLRDGRWVILNLIGKRNKVRTVPVPHWAKVYVDAWLFAASITDGVLFRTVRRGGHVHAQSMGAQGIYNVVKEYAPNMGAHDLRRTFARLARAGGASLRQIGHQMGHENEGTTERYVSEGFDLAHAPCDVLGLR